MKKLVYFLSFLYLTFTAQAQFIQGFGLFLSETMSRHEYKNTLPIDPITLDHAYPPSHLASEFHNWGVGIFMEMLDNSDWRWFTEIEYINKGSLEKREWLDRIPTATRRAANKMTYIEWNNILKRRIFAQKRYIPYVFIGLRLEYNLSRSLPSYPYISGSFTKFMAGGDAGAGAEFPLRRQWSLFGEAHYNPDILPQVMKYNTWVRNRTWEFRVGVIYRPKRGIGAYDIDCNAPKFRK